MASLALCAHVEIGASCATKTMILLIEHFTHFIVWYGCWVCLSSSRRLLLPLIVRSANESWTRASYMAIKTANRTAEAQRLAGVLVRACRSHMLGAASSKAAKPGYHCIRQCPCGRQSRICCRPRDGWVRSHFQPELCIILEPRIWFEAAAG